MKEGDKTPEEGLSEVEVGSLSEKEFRVVVRKMIQELGRGLNAQNEKIKIFNKELENVKEQLYRDEEQ